jgi:IPT/TIG domain
MNYILLVATLLALFEASQPCFAQGQNAEVSASSTSTSSQSPITISEQEYIADSTQRQHFSGSINVPKGQEQLALTLTYYNGTQRAPSFKWLRIASSSMNYITEAAFTSDKTAVVDVSGELTWGGNQILISGEGPKGALIGWRLTTPKPYISNIWPTTVTPGNTIVINGSNFCPDVSANVVVINNQTAQCVSATENRIVAQVPQDVKGGENSMHVVIAGIDAGTTKFMVNAAPHLTSVSASWVPPGQGFVINGEGFSPDINGNKVYIGPVQAQITNATATSISVIAPPAYGGYTWGYYQPVKVWVNGVRVRNQLTISVAD